MTDLRKLLPARRDWLAILLGASSLAGLCVLSQRNFLLFHCLTEAFSIVIAIAVFAIFWNTRQFLENGLFLVLGFGCLFAGVLDLIYIFGYPGMSMFPWADGNLALQAKTVAQWLVSLSCLCSMLFVCRKINQNLALSVYGALVAISLGAIFLWRVFPDCYRPGVGQTGFERIGLVISCGAYLGTLVLLCQRRSAFDPHVFRLLVAILIVFFVEDFASALATDINGPLKVVAHLCQVVALYFVYKAFVEVGLTRPFALLFRSQQQSAEDLYREKAFSDTVINGIPGVFYVLDVEGRLVRWNRAEEEMTGMPPEKLRGMNGLLTIHEDDRNLVAEKIREVFEKGQAQVETRVLTKDGARHFLLTGKRLDVGGTNYLVGSGIDITERKQAETALRASEDRYHSLFNAMTEGFALHEIVTDENGRPCDYRYLDVNPAFERLTGYQRGDVIGRLKRQVTPGEDEFWIQAYGAVACGGRPASFEHCAPNSKRHWQIYAYSPAPRQFAALFSDISQRKQAEQALQESEERYRLLVETIPQLAWRSSHDGLHLEFNRRWYEYTGQSPAEVGYHGWLAAVHPDDLSRVATQLLHAANNEQPYELEYRLRRASDDSYRWHLSRVIPLRGKDEQVISWFGCATDIEDLKQAQVTLKRANEEELQRHRAELAHVSRLSSLGEMAASLAHELNQPLHAMKNYARGSVRRLLKTPVRDEELLAVLEQIGAEANRAAEIVRRVRRFVQKGELRLCEVSVNDLVAEVVRLGTTELEPRRDEIVLELAPALPTVLGDPIQIEQVILNLVRNGLEAMEQTPPHDRSLRIRTLFHDGNAIQVEVSDRGKGVAAEDLEKIFAPFFTTKPDGMGMGLAISRSIIQAHGGRFWASLNERQGCTFHFTLPSAKRS